MKTINDMKVAKTAILSEMDNSSIGGYKVGSNTSYSGPSNPSSISTYVDGSYWGSDGSSGSLFGDSWNIGFSLASPAGKMLIKKG